MRVWMITGASGGFGREIARQALDSGDTVVATARRPGKIVDGLPRYGDRLMVAALDVTDEQRALHVVDMAVEAYGRIDVVVNNAGRGLFGMVEETSPAQARELFDVNVFGVLAVTRAALPVLRAQRGGHLLVMSSMGGFSSGAGFGMYAASKFAVEAMHEALHEELAPFGIAVTIVEPGVFDTGFATPMVTERIAEYAGALSLEDYAADEEPPGDPERAAASILAAVKAARPPLRLPIGADAFGRIRTKLAAVATGLDAIEASAR